MSNLTAALHLAGTTPPNIIVHDTSDTNHEENDAVSEHGNTPLQNWLPSALTLGARHGHARFAHLQLGSGNASQKGSRSASPSSGEENPPGSTISDGDSDIFKMDMSRRASSVAAETNVEEQVPSLLANMENACAKVLQKYPDWETDEEHSGKLYMALHNHIRESHDTPEDIKKLQTEVAESGRYEPNHPLHAALNILTAGIPRRASPVPAENDAEEQVPSLLTNMESACAEAMQMYPNWNTDEDHSMGLYSALRNYIQGSYDTPDDMESLRGEIAQSGKYESGHPVHSALEDVIEEF